MFVSENVHMCVQMPLESRKCVNPLELELQHGCWDLNSVPWQEQCVLLSAEPSLQSPNISLKLYVVLCSMTKHLTRFPVNHTL